jgi:hypothetical protein
MWKKALVVIAAAVTVAACGPAQSRPSVTSDEHTAVVTTSAPSIPSAAPTPSAVPATTALPAPPVVQTLPTQPPAPATTRNTTAQNNTTGSCGSDYYRNSDGVCVHRPASGPGAPAGATARCNDGSYSYSTHRSGTCSHHGGVAVWY